MWRDSETKVDFLDFDYLKEILKDVIMNEKLTPSTIGVYGDWGSGKSSLIEMVMEELEKEKEKGVICIKFNGWLFEGYEDAKTSFMGVVLDEISNRKEFGDKIKDTLKTLYKNINFLKLASFTVKHGTNYFLTGGTGSFLSILGDQFKNKVKEISEEDIYNTLENTFSSQNLRQSISKFRDEFRKLLEEAKIKRLVIFIDELDRCSSETILETFEAMRLFLFTENTSFIIGADERHIEYAVKHKFSEIEGNNINIGKEYLEKIIQYPVKIPQLGRREMINYIICLFFQEELTPNEFEEFSQMIKENKNTLDFEIDHKLIEDHYPTILEKVKNTIYLAKTLGPILAKGLNGNPRHCKRFLNALSMRIEMGKYKKIDLDRKVLGKMMILEYFNQNYFKDLPGLLDENGRIKELEFFEKIEKEGEKIKLDVLEKYKEDSEFKKWAELDPEISEIDIRPYLYFTRDTLHNFGTFNYRLSEIGKEILKNILSNSQINQNKGFDRLKEITDSEADYIYNELIKSYNSETGETNKKFQILIKYCSERKEKKDEFVRFLKEIPGTKIQIGIIPNIKGYFKNIDLKGEGEDIMKKWSQENKKLEKAVAGGKK